MHPAPPPPDVFWRTMKILWAALISSQLLFVALLVWFEHQGVLAGRSAPPLFTPVFLGVAVCVAVVSFVLPRQAIRARAASLKVVRRPDPDQLRQLMPAAQVALILGLALCESISIFGFVLGFLGAPPSHFAPFFAAGILLSLVRFPTESWLLGHLPDADVS